MEFSKELNESPKIETDTKAAHTPYIPTIDVEAVLGDSPLLDTPITSKARILSPSSCKPYVHDTLRSLLSDMLLDIVSKELLIDGTTSACVSAFKDKPVSLTVAGPTAHLSAVERILKTQSIKYQIKQHRNADKGIFTRGGSDSVAVVGMSARLPGSDTVDAFFETLMEGKIQLKKVHMGSNIIHVCIDDGRFQRQGSTSINTMILLAHEETPRPRIRVRSSSILATLIIAFSASRHARHFKWIHFNVCCSPPAGKL
jgi:hypothetical protein